MPLANSKTTKKIIHHSSLNRQLLYGEWTLLTNIWKANSSFSTQIINLLKKLVTCTQKPWTDNNRLYLNMILSFNIKKGKLCQQTICPDCHLLMKINWQKSFNALTHFNQSSLSYKKLIKTCKKLIISEQKANGQQASQRLIVIIYKILW